MANPVQILDKIERNLKQRGITAVRVDDRVDAAGLQVTYVSKDIQKPMGGVDDSLSPFLGIGIGAPGSIKIKGTTVGSTMATVIDSLDAAAVLAECSGFANDIQMEAQDGTDLGRIAGSTDTLGTGS